MNPIATAAIANIIVPLIRLLMSKGEFKRIENIVLQWVDKEISGTEKRHGVMAELQIIGLKSAEWAVRFCIELIMGMAAGYDSTRQPTKDELLNLAKQKLKDSL